MRKTEIEVWKETAEMLGNYSVTWSDHWSYNYRNDPKRLAFVLSRYKFASKMNIPIGGHKRTVLELGCGEGIGATILAESASAYTGVDLDAAAILTAKRNFSPPHHDEGVLTFIYDDFMGKTFGTFQTLVSLDVVEHIYPEHERCYFETVMQNLAEGGIAIIGTPNITAAPYASEASQLGHVNLFSQKRLKETLEHYFHTVFAFGINDEMVHTGYAPMAHYLVCVACHRRERW
jgi:2-polyprenyl-3-methyl-5-hydroxy-6-metoxy-1,4-benzoquinol methylase